MSKIEFSNLFPDLETCKKFQEMGVFQESNFVWVNLFEDEFPKKREEVLYAETYPAPTTDEIIAKLPKTIEYKGNIYKGCFTFNEYEGCYYRLKTHGFLLEKIFNVWRKFPVQALAELYLKLKAEKII